MEDLAQLLKLSLRLRASLESGETIRKSISRFLEENKTRFAFKIQEWLFYFDQTNGNDRSRQFFENNHVRVFLNILAQGLLGHSIYDRLKSYEEELIEVCKDEVQKKIDRLPYELMIPLLLLMFPAYLLLILGPILNLFLKAL